MKEFIRSKVSGILIGGLVVALGFLAGETLLAPQPLQANNCAFSQCFASPGGDTCEADINPNNCEFGIEICQTVACDDGGGDGDPGPVE